MMVYKTHKLESYTVEAVCLSLKCFGDANPLSCFIEIACCLFMLKYTNLHFCDTHVTIKSDQNLTLSYCHLFSSMIEYLNRLWSTIVMLTCYLCDIYITLAVCNTFIDPALVNNDDSVKLYVCYYWR